MTFPGPQSSPLHRSWGHQRTFIHEPTVDRARRVKARPACTAVAIGLGPAGKNCMQWVTNVTYCAEGARRRRPTHDHTSTAPKAPAEGGRHTSTAFLLKNAPISLKNTIFSKGAFGARLRRGPSARAFGPGLRPPSPPITYWSCNFCHPAVELGTVSWGRELLPGGCGWVP